MFENQKKDDEGRGEDGKFLPGNKFWLGTNVGAKKIFETPEDLQQACFDYFNWVDENPLWEMKVFGSGLKAKLPHPRAMSIRGLCVHIGMNRRSWDNYRARDEFKEICEMAEDIMFEQKFAGAAAGLFNGNIIARDLGLADKKHVEGDLIVEVIDSFSEDDEPGDE